MSQDVPQNPERAFRRFEDAMRKLVRVPKEEVDQKIAASRRPRKKKPVPPL